MMGADLIEQLKQVEDFRTTDGRRHPLWLVLLLVIMGTMNGYVGYRGWGDFALRHSRVLVEKFGIQKHGVPSYSTIRRVVMGVDFDKLAQRFNEWAKNYVDLEVSQWCATDGKSIKGTVQRHLQVIKCPAVAFALRGESARILGLNQHIFDTAGHFIFWKTQNYSSYNQNFVSIVSVFACKRGLVVGMEKCDNQQKSEIQVVQELINALGLEAVVLSFDSLHCQKKLAK